MRAGGLAHALTTCRISGKSAPLSQHVSPSVLGESRLKLPLVTVRTDGDRGVGDSGPSGPLISNSPPQAIVSIAMAGGVPLQDIHDTRTKEQCQLMTLNVSTRCQTTSGNKQNRKICIYPP